MSGRTGLGVWLLVIVALALPFFPRPVSATTSAPVNEDETSSPTGSAAERSDIGRRAGRGGTTPGGNLSADAEVVFIGDRGAQTVPVGTSTFSDCTWDQIEGGEVIALDNRNIEAININGSVFDEDHWVVFCPRRVAFDVYTFYPVGDPPPTPVIEDLIADAYAQTPVKAFNPITSPPGDEDIPLITQMTAFLWVDEAAWNESVSATATVADFSVTTTATARSARWDGGDAPVYCNGDDMHEYIVGIGGDDAQPSNCSTVFRRSSAVQDHTIELAVTWDVSYTCSDPTACGGDLPDIITTGTRDVLVGEILAVES